MKKSYVIKESLNKRFDIGTVICNRAVVLALGLQKSAFGLGLRWLPLDKYQITYLITYRLKFTNVIYAFCLIFSQIIFQYIYIM